MGRTHGAVSIFGNRAFINKRKISEWVIMRIGIIGGGSIGLLIGSYLSSRHQVTMYVRNEQQKESLNHKGIRRADASGKAMVQALLSNELSNEDCFIVCVKQGHIADIVPLLALVNKDTPVVFLQNGMGHLQAIKSIEQPILLGVVDHGALKSGHHTITQLGKGSIRVAAFSNADERIKGLVDAFHQLEFPVYMETDWSKLLTEKLIVNAVINPITALFDTKNGAIIHNRYLNALAKRLCEEAALILQLDPSKQWERIKQVANNTTENTSSMLKDLKEKRETELEAITGYLIQVNNDHWIPNTLFVYHSVKALEVKKGIID